MSESRATAWRRRLSEVLLAVQLELGPAPAPPWRFDHRFRPAAMLMVGEPTPALDGSASGRHR